MQFDIGRQVAVFVAGLDNIRIERTLGEEFGVFDFGSLGFESLDEFGADDFAFFLRVGDAGQLGQELSGPVHDAQVDMEMAAEHRLDTLPFIFTQQAVIHKYTNQLIANGFVQQGRSDG